MAVIYKGSVLGPPGCCGAYMCRLRTNKLAVKLVGHKLVTVGG